MAQEEWGEMKTRVSERETACFLDGWVSGFEKARAMASDLTKRHPWIAVRDMPMLGEENAGPLKTPQPGEAG